jgi:sugar lactone lactonase YvrE
MNFTALEHTHRAAAMAVLFGLTGAATAQDGSLGNTQVFASVPAPGYPEGIAVRGGRVYVSGPAAFGLNQAPMVWAYDLKTKALVAQYPIKFMNQIAGMRALSCIAFGPDGKLYAIEPFVGIIRMTLDPGNTQEIYSAFPPPPQTGALPNDLAFDAYGDLYVSESFQGLIYRVPAGGGAPQVWFQDPRLLGSPQLPFGVNGVRVDKGNNFLYMTVTVRPDLSGAIYRLPLASSPVAADLSEFHVYPATQQFGPPAPDGIAFGKSGMMYVAMAGASQISTLRPDGTEAMVFSGPARIAGSTTALPWANPANIAFSDQEGTILVTNHASLVPYDPNLFAVFDVFVNDKGEPLP